MVIFISYLAVVKSILREHTRELPFFTLPTSTLVSSCICHGKRAKLQTSVFLESLKIMSRVLLIVTDHAHVYLHPDSLGMRHWDDGKEISMHSEGSTIGLTVLLLKLTKLIYNILIGLALSDSSHCSGGIILDWVLSIFRLHFLIGQNPVWGRQPL